MIQLSVWPLIFPAGVFAKVEVSVANAGEKTYRRVHIRLATRDALIMRGTAVIEVPILTPGQAHRHFIELHAPQAGACKLTAEDFSFYGGRYLERLPRQELDLQAVPPAAPQSLDLVVVLRQSGLQVGQDGALAGTVYSQETSPIDNVCVELVDSHLEARGPSIVTLGTVTPDRPRDFELAVRPMRAGIPLTVSLHLEGSFNGQRIHRCVEARIDVAPDPRPTQYNVSVGDVVSLSRDSSVTIGSVIHPGASASGETSARVRCLRCCRLNPVDNQFCIHCGQLLPVTPGGGGKAQI